ncbi:hypothetical protein HOG16_00750 [Candidatus Woesearchaeota archaeon]|jgi:hypothetical protein|nr:hypothetical protein [Candidatus Woesearchaeota archaeon]MBT4322119.1 hypothetical protein [Candidatus Woesearchaeota archaeon]MBT4630696.1 hypothetical protein [Candidatus Woesearchaeota archaeon]
MKILDKFNKDKINYLLILCIVLYVAVIIPFLLSLNQLPSPIYGGDYYYQLGGINHIKYGGDIFGGSNVLEGLPGYLPFYALLVAVFSNIFFLSGITAMLSMSVLFSILSFLTLFFVSYKLFKNKLIAIATVLLILGVKSSMIMKYTPFTSFIIMPLVFISLLYTIKTKSYKYAVLTGIIYGISAISHGVSFISSTILIGVSTLYFGIFRNLKNKKAMIKFLKVFGILILIGLIIAQLYWFKPIFVHHGQTNENYLDWNNKDFSNGETQKDFVVGVFKGLFFNFSGISNIIVSLLCILGILTLFLIKKENTLTRYINVFLISAIIGLFHFFITRPLIGVDFYPTRMSDFFIPIVKTIFIGLSLTLILKKVKIKKNIIPFLLILLLLPLNLMAFNEYSQENMWAKQGRNPLPENLEAMSEYIIENTDVNDVFLSSNELSFALNGLTGRKVLVSRRAQNDPFLDMEERVKAAAIILYSNNEELRQHYIEKFKIKYLFWSGDWITTEYRLDDKGQIVDRFDPLLIFDTPENRDFLDSNEITYFNQHTWVDPTLQGEEYKKFDLLFILPKRNSFETLWDESLDDHLEEVWNYEKDGQILSRIYEVK